MRERRGVSDEGVSDKECESVRVTRECARVERKESEKKKVTAVRCEVRERECATQGSFPVGWPKFPGA